MEDTNVISPPKLFTKPSQTTMTPQQNMMNGTVLISSLMVRQQTWDDTYSTSMGQPASAPGSCQAGVRKATGRLSLPSLTRELQREHMESVRSQLSMIRARVEETY